MPVFQSLSFIFSFVVDLRIHFVFINYFYFFCLLWFLSGLAVLSVF
ncbi:hypothetical protein MsAc7_18030 [Methanolapillus millepedarum]|uniref:Uncharacterized protein n=1 Tax=Methanolapillus millepedarum TaxID=3028296 RepID=A0AA97A519_9EURY|nr:hypothetical protein MsAc7_18030 [Methanosarcinaceae archaeon Ac7]